MVGPPPALRITGPFPSLSEPQLDRFAEVMSSTNPWLHFGYSTQECRDKLSAQRYQILIASQAGFDLEILYFASEGDLGGPFIRYVLVDSDKRSRGVGSTLIRTLLSEHSGKSCYLTVSETNEQAKRLYKRLGFSVIGSIRDYNFWGESVFIMRYPGSPKREALKEAR